MRRSGWTYAVLVPGLLLAVTAAAQPPDAGVSPTLARELNTRGFRLYRQGRFTEALALFQQAVQADDRHALAHYNLAATLGVLRTRGEVCSYDAYKARIVQHLARAVALDPRRRARMVKDRDLDPVRDTIGYQRLLGFSPEREGDVRRLLVEVSWFGPGVGAFGSRVGIDFLPRGRVVVWRKELGPEDLEPRRVAHAGTFRTDGRKVRLELAQPIEGKVAFRGQLEPGGRLVLDEPIGALEDQPSECDA